MKRIAVITTALVAAGALAAVAWAVSVRDRDDVTHGLDIAKAAGSHNRATDQLVHTVDLYEGVEPADMVNRSKPPSSVCVLIWTRSRPAESPADYELCATPARRGRTWTASLARKRAEGPRLRIAKVKVEQPGETRLVMRIDPDDIKRPARYRWRAETTSFAAPCKSAAGCPDYTPDRPDTAETRLSKPRS
jgi:hypothetical protein